MTDIDDGIDDSAIREAAKSLTVSFQKRLAGEMLAAWRADYPVLDVIRSPSMPGDSPLSIQMAFIPRRSRDAPRLQHRNAQRYAIDSLTDDDIDRLRQVRGNDADS